MDTKPDITNDLLEAGPRAVEAVLHRPDKQIPADFVVNWWLVEEVADFNWGHFRETDPPQSIAWARLALKVKKGLLKLHRGNGELYERCLEERIAFFRDLLAEHDVRSAETASPEQVAS